jgi:hypothetical protein
MTKEKSTKGQRSTKHTYKRKDQVTRTPLKTGGELRFRRVGSFCSTSDTRRVNLVTNSSLPKQVLPLSTEYSYASLLFENFLFFCTLSCLNSIVVYNDQFKYKCMLFFSGLEQNINTL